MTREELIEVMARRMVEAECGPTSVYGYATAALAAIEAAGARHEAVELALQTTGLRSQEAHADRATLLRALDDAQERAERAERNRDMWKGQCERQAERLTVLNRAVAEISRGVQSGVDPQASIERLVTIARNAAPEIVSSELPAAQTLKERKDG